jgi:hypothetical protein
MSSVEGSPLSLSRRLYQLLHLLPGCPSSITHRLHCLLQNEHHVGNVYDAVRRGFAILERSDVTPGIVAGSGGEQADGDFQSYHGVSDIHYPISIHIAQH